MNIYIQKQTEKRDNNKKLDIMTNNHISLVTPGIKDMLQLIADQCLNIKNNECSDYFINQDINTNNGERSNRYSLNINFNAIKSKMNSSEEKIHFFVAN